MRWRIALAACALLGVAAPLTLHEFHGQQRPQAAQAVSAPIQLNGILEPLASVPIDVPILTVAVPLNTRVRRGQVIGTGDYGEDGAEHPPVLAPADGVLVPEDLAQGRFGIAQDATPQLNVMALAPEAGMHQLHAGQQAVLLVGDAAHTRLSAIVREVGESPVMSDAGVVSYPVALTAENPGKLWLAGISAEILVSATAEAPGKILPGR